MKIVNKQKNRNGNPRQGTKLMRMMMIHPGKKVILDLKGLEKKIEGNRGKAREYEIWSLNLQEDVVR
ncbi:hypothetical protein J5N97_026091 [Dioscorea zingiberensis]|uniref:Uncharacterized protein n=1 Tax=Dioscorea zingiberensis TaxID=325984 RepID=A0A9D5H6B6_9LILI|nr:hypothetical protein J5N97_026091 [Dioscorea zingiberensis]